MYFSASTHDIVGMNNLGQIVKFYNTTDKYLLHHDYAMDDDGNLVVLATDTTKTTMQDQIITIDGDSGEITNVVDMTDLYSSYEESTATATMGTKATDNSSSASATTGKASESTADSDSTKKDWLHLNTIQLTGDGSAILSSRETSTIIKISDVEGDPSIDYMIGESSFWEGTDYSQYLLTKDTSDGDWPSTGGQHSVTYVEDASLPDGQYYLYLFDNNFGLSNTRPDYSWTDNIEGIDTGYTEGTNSNYYKYLVDENAGTYKLVNPFEVPYSSIVSSAEEYSDGTIVIDSGMKGTWGVYSDDGTLIQQYKMKILQSMIYRVYKYDFAGFYFAS